MAQFVDFGPRLISAPPVVCKKSVLYLLHVAADLNKLNAICARVFNRPLNSVTCFAISDQVQVIFGRIDWVGTDKTAIGINAGVTEVQLMFRIGVEVLAGAVPVPQLAYFSPFVWVNNPVSMAGGREVFGYPKTFGQLTLAGTSNAPSMVLKTWCGNIGDHRWNERELISILPHKSGTKNRGALNQKSQQLLDDWLNGSLTEIFLKQFLSIDSSFQYMNACFQQIATAQYQAASVKQKVLPGSFDLTIRKFQSAPLFDELGVKSTTGLEVTQLEIDDFVIGKPQILWQAP